jgi:signal transduction histidine kinase
VVKTVAEAHGGELVLNSTPERGTSIELDLPRVAAVDPPLSPPAEAREVA